MPSQSIIQDSTLLGKYRILLSHFLSLTRSTKAGKLVALTWGSGIICSIMYLINHHRIKKITPSGKQTHTHVHKHTDKHRSQFRKEFAYLFIRMCPPFFSKGSFIFVIYTIILALRIVITTKLADLAGNLAAQMGSQNWDKMFESQCIFALWSIPAALSNGLMKYLEWGLVLELRKRLQQYLHKLYFNNNQFYNVNTSKNRIAYIDQRITDDCAIFSHDIVHFYGHVMKPLVDICFLFKTLKDRIGLEQVIGYISFFYIASKTISLLIPDIGKLTMLKQETEAQFRTQHSNVVNYTEEIAFLKGGEQEKKTSDALFNVLSAQEEFRHRQLLFVNSLNSYVLKYGAAMVAYSVMIPSTYFGTETDSRKITRHYVSSTSLLISFGKALKSITVQYKRLAKIKAMCNRIFEVVSKLQNHCPSKIHSLQKHETKNTETNQQICVKNVNLITPSSSSHKSRLLIQNLSVTIGYGEHLLVTGPNGSGKTTFFRLLAGLWQTPGVSVPNDMIFVPQKSYMTSGTLINQIVYPKQAYSCPIPTLPDDASQSSTNYVSDWDHHGSNGDSCCSGGKKKQK